METVACNLCGSEDHRFVYRAPDGLYFPDRWFDVVECRGCGLGFVNPRPAIDEISAYYQGDYYDSLADDLHIRRFEAESRYLPEIGHGSPPPRLLDIGCGPGGFPRFMAAQGWRVEGVEPLATQPIEDFPVYRQAFDRLEGRAGRYDAVTAWAVLEHVHDPMAYFMKAGEVLKPGGVFVFLVTNFDSLSSKRLFHEDVPRHLHFYTKETVKRFLRAAGLALVTADFDRNIYAMGTRGAVKYLFVRHIVGKPYEWSDRPASFRRFCEQCNLGVNGFSLLRFIAADPVACLDRLAEPFVERWQLLSNTYGIVTYVARKP